jgi:hypothetical protein
VRVGTKLDEVSGLNINRNLRNVFHANGSPGEAALASIETRPDDQSNNPW